MDILLMMKKNYKINMIKNVKIDIIITLKKNTIEE